MYYTFGCCIKRKARENIQVCVIVLPTSYQQVTDTLPTVVPQVAYISGKTCSLTVDQQTTNSQPTVDRQSADRFFGELFFTITHQAYTYHSQCLTPWDSHGPFSLKRGTLIGEIKRVITHSTDAQPQQASTKLITKLHKRNGYPKRFVNSTIKRTLWTCNVQPTEQEQELEQYPEYIKVPGPKTTNARSNQVFKISKLII